MNEENSVKKRNSYKCFFKTDPYERSVLSFPFGSFYTHIFGYYNLLILDTSGCFVYFWQIILHVKLLIIVCFHSCIMELYIQNVPLPTLITTGAHLMM